MPPQYPLPSQASSMSLNNLLNPAGNMNNSFMVDQVNQSMLNNLSFQSERTPMHANQQANMSMYSIPSSASAMMQLNQQQQQQQQQQQFTPYLNHQLAPSQMSASQAPLPNLFPTMRGQQAPPPLLPPAPQQQQQQQFNLPASGSANFKPIPAPIAAAAVPVSQFNPSQPPPPPPAVVQPPPATQTQPKPLFSFSNLNKPTTEPAVAQAPRQTLFNAPLSTQTTSTPQSGQFMFSKQPTQQLLDQQKPKPPQFQFSPTKQPESKPETTVQAPSIFGSNLFKTTATITTPEKQQQPAKTSLFGGLATTQPLFKTPDTTTKPTHDEEGTEGGENGANPEDFEPQLDFKPLVKLHEVEVKTGEEDEDVLFKQRCKLFRFDINSKEWKEKGLGDLKFLKHKTTNAIRLLMRREQVHKICANHRISATMTLKEISPKQYSWMANDYSDNEPKTELLLAKFKLVEEAAEFKNQFEKAVQARKNAGGDVETPTKPQAPPAATAPVVNKLGHLLKTDTWNCSACYAPNKKDDLKCICCATTKPGVTQVDAPLASNLPQPAANAPFSFGLKSTSVTASPTKPAFSFGLPQNSQSPQKSEVKPFSFAPMQPQIAQASKPFSFGALSTQTTQPSKLDFSVKPPQSKPVEAAKETAPLFQKTEMPSFASLAATSSGTSLFGNLNSTVSASPILKNVNPAFGGGLQASAQPAKPLFSGFTLPKPAETNVEGDEGETATENPEEYEPQVDFKPLVKLHEVEVKTGEENEVVVFKSRCKLFRFDNTLKEWKEKGTGEVKLLRHKGHHNMHRILMRRDQVLKLCANHRITSELSFEQFNEKQIRWHAQDYSEGECRHELLAARFKHEDEAKSFKAECDKALAILHAEPATPAATESKPVAAVTSSCAGLKNTLSEMFKSDGSWKCTACYAPNKQEVVKCACCGTLKPGATEPVATIEADKVLTNNFGKITFGAQPAAAKKGEEPAKFDFGTKIGFQPFQATSKPAEEAKPSLFGNKPLMFGGLNATPDAASIFGAKSDVSFADLAKKAQPTGFAGGFLKDAAQQPSSLFANFKPAPVFGAQPAEEAEEAGAEQNPEEYIPQVDFKPLVKLHEVEVKTGEEDEEVLFKQRCKLFRFNSETKEWKEKGVGDIKILKHKHKESHYRILMRRDQVLKLCANHRISTTLKLENVNEKQISWIVTDYSEEIAHAEVLLAKFRHEEEALKFKTEFERVQKILATAPVPVAAAAATAAPTINKFSNLVKKAEEGSWKCEGCLATNKPNTTKCACCDTPKPNDSGKFEILFVTILEF